MKIGIAAILTGLALAVPAVTPAQAWVRKDVSEYAGRRCSAPPRGSGIIFGQFSGHSYSSFDDGIDAVDRVRCFTSMSECKGWLYTMQSKYSDAGVPTIVQCTKR
ncbi:MAG: metallophosphoesterase [Rhizobiales bacterium]|nr:metallophosphoesterase [Hyphomicrobiales bacterium]